MCVHTISNLATYIKELTTDSKNLYKTIQCSSTRVNRNLRIHASKTLVTSKTRWVDSRYRHQHNFSGTDKISPSSSFTSLYLWQSHTHIHGDEERTFHGQQCIMQWMRQHLVMKLHVQYSNVNEKTLVAWQRLIALQYLHDCVVFANATSVSRC